MPESRIYRQLTGETAGFEGCHPGDNPGNGGSDFIIEVQTNKYNNVGLPIVLRVNSGMRTRRMQSDHLRMWLV